MTRKKVKTIRHWIFSFWLLWDCPFKVPIYFLLLQSNRNSFKFFEPPEKDKLKYLQKIVAWIILMLYCTVACGIDLFSRSKWHGTEAGEADFFLSGRLWIFCMRHWFVSDDYVSMCGTDFFPDFFPDLFPNDNVAECGTDLFTNDNVTVHMRYWFLSEW